MKKFKKPIIIILCAVVVVFGITFAVSHLVFHRSIMSSLAELYMVIIDRDSIYEEGEKYDENIQLRAVMSLRDYEKPVGVSMDIPYYSVHEHGMQVYYFNEETFTDTIIMYIPGGAYLNDPLKYHWSIINKLSKKTDTPVIMPLYLKTPNYTCEESYEAMMELYLDVSSREGVERIIFIGDSSGGGMSLVLAQLLRDEHPEVLQPDDLILIAPWMDVSMENEEIADYEPIDPMLDIYGAKDLGIRWAGNRDVHDPMASPIYGTFENLGHITLFIGTRDMLYPDIAKFSAILDEQGIEHNYIVKEGLDHPYPLFPTPEAAEAQKLMIKIINNED